MEGLLQSFDTSVNVSFDEYDIHTKHPRFSQYKEKFTKSNQEQRRRDLLLEQKEKKIKVINVKRGIVEKEVIKEIEKELTECVNTFPKYSRPYKDALMMSEWLIDVPQDFYEKWIVVPCPVGKRILLVAEKGSTTAYARKGFNVIQRFPSGLPGGSQSSSNRRCFTRLDCIWHEPTRTIFIIDVLELGPNLVDCECQFRFMWLEWKFNELGESITVPTRLNRFKMVMLNRFRASELPEYVKEPLCPDIKMDGLLFFHEEGLYEEFSKSPLVTWLKPYMVPDVLKLTTHPDYMVDRPSEWSMELDSVNLSTSSTKKPGQLTPPDSNKESTDQVTIIQDDGAKMEENV